jgi:hypothetical protein
VFNSLQILPVLRRGVIGWEAFIGSNVSNEAENAVMNVLLYLMGIFCFLATLGLRRVKNKKNQKARLVNVKIRVYLCLKVG